MGNLVEAKVTIRGDRPMLWHAFGPDSIPLEKGEKTGVAGNDPAEWRKSVLCTKNGQLFIRGDYVFGCLAGKDGAAKYTKKGRGTLLSPVRATLQIAEDRILVDRYMPGFPNGHECDPLTLDVPDTDPDLPVYLDIRGCVNPNTRSRNVRYRIAASPGWTCSFTLQWDKTVVSRHEMEAIMIDAGRLVGLGNGRAIGMGRFNVESFDVDDMN